MSLLQRGMQCFSASEGSAPLPRLIVSFALFVVRLVGLSLGNGWYATKGGGEPEPTVPRVFRAKLMIDGQAAVTTTRVSAKVRRTPCPDY